MNFNSRLKFHADLNALLHAVKLRELQTVIYVKARFGSVPKHHQMYISSLEYLKFVLILSYCFCFSVNLILFKLILFVIELIIGDWKTKSTNTWKLRAESYLYQDLFSVVQSRQRVIISLSEWRRILNFKHMYCKLMQRLN